MTVAQGSVKEIREQILILGRIGLEHQVRPIRDSHSSITSHLFELDADCRERALALERFEAAFAETPPVELGPGDARIYRRERERRLRHLEQVRKERDDLLEVYAAELLASPRHHPALTEAYAELGVFF
ncbi:MAG: hypothetical protein H6807_17395 [Planctomycetes bacterium]|nr:hypothetical protein [Planctomycetota bacterium]